MSIYLLFNFHRILNWKVDLVEFLCNVSLAISAFLLNRNSIKRMIRLTIYIPIVLCYYIIPMWIVPQLYINLSPYISGLLLHLSSISWVFVFWYYVTDRPAFFALSIYFGAAIGNTLSYLYPPFVPIDFIHIKFPSQYLLTKLFLLLGVDGSVVNIADIAMTVVVVFLFAYSPVYIFKKTGASGFRKV